MAQRCGRRLSLRSIFPSSGRKISTVTIFRRVFILYIILRHFTIYVHNINRKKNDVPTFVARLRAIISPVGWFFFSIIIIFFIIYCYYLLLLLLYPLYCRRGNQFVSGFTEASNRRDFTPLYYQTGAISRPRSMRLMRIHTHNRTVRCRSSICRSGHE